MKPVLDPDYLPIIEFERQYLAASSERTHCVLTLEKNPQQIARQEVLLCLEQKKVTLRYLNRYIKTMLWIYGGHRLYLDLGAEWVAELERIFATEQKFDSDFIVEGIFGHKFEILSCPEAQMPRPCTQSSRIGGKSGGRRLGFDVGGSDRKIAAIAENKVLFADSIIWDPYPQSNLEWHRCEMRKLFDLGASKLPGPVEAVGGSAPGIIMDNEVKVGSLFRGLKDEAQCQESCSMFQDIVGKLFGDIPFRLANDGDVTALAGAMLLNKNNLLGIAMGTSEAAGYTNPQGAINSWFSELAFVPVDMGPHRSQDEWSKDWGTGVEYFSQQAVLRLAPKVGIELPADLPKPKKLAWVQQKLEGGQPEERKSAAQIFETIGCYLGYALPWYHRFYAMENVLLLGRVLKGQGGKIIVAEAQKILREEFPELKLALFTLTDEEILHGQAMAAASLA